MTTIEHRPITLNTTPAAQLSSNLGVDLGSRATREQTQPTVVGDERSFHRIVVGVSGSDASLGALAWAGRVGDALGMAIDAIMCWEVDSDHEFSAGRKYRPLEDARLRLDHCVTAAFGQDVPESLRVMIRQGRAGRVLVDAGQGAEMLVVGSRGQKALAALVFGSVSTYCAQHASCPVVVTPARRNDPWPAAVRRRSRAATAASPRDNDEQVGGAQQVRTRPSWRDRLLPHAAPRRVSPGPDTTPATESPT